MDVAALVDAGFRVTDGLVTLLFGSGVLGVLGVMLTTRDSRQRRYDERASKELENLRADLRRAEEEREKAETREQAVKDAAAASVAAADARARESDAENSRLREEETRLRVLCRANGVDPDSVVEVP